MGIVYLEYQMEIILERNVGIETLHDFEICRSGLLAAIGRMALQEMEPLRDEFGSIIPPMPSGPVQPSSEVYGQGCILSLVGDESDPVAAPKLTLLAKSNDGTMQNNITRLVQCTILKGPRRHIGLDVVAIVYDPLYVPLCCLPILWPQEDRQDDAHDNGFKNETAQVDKNCEDNQHEKHSTNGTANTEGKSWMDYMPPPNPLVTPPTKKTLTDRGQRWDRKIQLAQRMRKSSSPKNGDVTLNSKTIRDALYRNSWAGTPSVLTIANTRRIRLYMYC